MRLTGYYTNSTPVASSYWGFLLPNHKNMKKCPKCKLYKNTDAFYKGSNPYCKPCAIIKALAYKKMRRANKNYKKIVSKTMKEYKLLQKYGLSLEAYNKLLIKQDGKCAICDKYKPLNVDHCHKTGKVRGLLCFNCNTGIGKLYEDKDILHKAINYLK